MSKKEFTPETDGTRNGQPIYCLVNSWECPYYKDGKCCIENPVEDYDDFSSFWERWEELNATD